MATRHYGAALLAFWGYGVARREADVRTHQSVVARTVKFGDRRKLQKELRKKGVRMTLRELKELSKTSGKVIKQRREEKVQSIGDAIPGVKSAPRWNTDWESEEYQIDGIIDSGDREEDRAFREIYGQSGDWGRISSAFKDGTLTADQAGDWFVDDVFFSQYSLSVFDLPGTEYSCHVSQAKRSW